MSIISLHIRLPCGSDGHLANTSTVKSVGTDEKVRNQNLHQRQHPPHQSLQVSGDFLNSHQLVSLMHNGRCHLVSIVDGIANTQPVRLVGAVVYIDKHYSVSVVDQLY